MKVHGSRRGTALIDVLVTVFLLAVVGIIFSATLPTGFACSRKAQEWKSASAIAQRKMEQLRAANYESLTQPLLAAAGTIDADSASSPYTFTSVDSLATQLTRGIGTIAVADISSTVKRVQVTVSWLDRTGTRRSLCLTSYFADKRPRAVS